ncbi:hypothetical protein AB0758_27095 [Tolypothrix bouteillei VB521301_2]|uniref:hypothetical protein n=1 Tax=Tolypothrix bouteillei TaxID=1246981 RepID=UPI001436B122|nr:hypothetical protein [Tolypothrix bouteillei]
MAEKSRIYERDISLIKQFVYSLLLEKLRQYRACEHTTVMLRKKTGDVEKSSGTARTLSTRTRS